MEQAPVPLTTPDIDVRDLDGFMLNSERLLASELWAIATGEEFKAAVGLWCRAWKQIPAGSLPEDHRVLASFAGVTAARWLKVRDMALRGFIRCADGRLYHRVLCEDALRAYGLKSARRAEANADAERKRREREDRAALFEVLREAGHTPAWNTSTRDLRLLANQVTGHVTGAVTPEVTAPVTRTGTVLTGQDGTRRDETQRESRTSPPPSGVSSRDPAASGGARQRVQGVDCDQVAAAVERGDLLAILSAFGCATGEAQRGEWLRDTDGMQLGTVVVVLAWRRSIGDHVRQPSGWRVARKAWRALPADERAAVGADLAPAYGLPAPTAAVPGDRPMETP